ncbi:MAG: flagellar biosynthetic protein FliR [Burkholderiaceae bacterium]|nr:flagellar biosynthetic protein FliR [Burkholderiaceae bacterium]
MITVTSAELHTWISSFLWPLTRILGLIAVAPLYSNVSIPATVKLTLGIMISFVIAPSVPPLPALDPMSLQGLLILAQQFVIGAAMGFTIRIVFAAMEMAGEITGMTMGLGFATFFDPMSQGRSSAISQFMALLTLMIYLATNLHLALLSILADSFSTIPISSAPLSGEMFRLLAEFGGQIFSAGVQLSLPLIAALLITNMSLGILTRAAPQLNLFGIGFPITIGVGFLMIGLVLPYLVTPLDHLFQQGFGILRQITAGQIALTQ